ncbi:MAG: hypothetical protein E7571_07445 [Ruminococcaceae bacterium]|nr:hypothetical protein [Oscillospiraceae bacterium]
MKKFVKATLMSALSLIIGFLAISLPFNLFSTLSSVMIQRVFLGELVIYFVIAMLFLVFQQKKKERLIKSEQRHTARREKIARVQTEWYDLAA